MSYINFSWLDDLDSKSDIKFQVLQVSGYIERNIKDLPIKQQEQLLSISSKMSEKLHQLHFDKDAIIAGMLYYPVRKGVLPVTNTALMFGELAVDLIRDVIKLTSLAKKDYRVLRLGGEKKSYKVDFDLNEDLFSLMSDPRLLLIKIVERVVLLEDTKTRLLEADEQLSLSKSKAEAKEAFRIWFPLTRILSLGKLTSNLSDSIMAILHTKNYTEIFHRFNDVNQSGTELVDSFQVTLMSILAQCGIKGEVSSRTKSIYSVWRKMRRKTLNVDDIKDYFAVRAIVKTEDGCYQLLDEIRKRYKEDAKDFDDYIKGPKINGYQSLHTVIMLEHNVKVELQIRTQLMDLEAQEGVCAHWLYKDKIPFNPDFYQRIEQVKSLLIQ